MKTPLIRVSPPLSPQREYPLIENCPLFTRVSSVFDRMAASPTTVGFGSHCCVLRKAVLAKTSLVRSRSRNGFTTDTGLTIKDKDVLYGLDRFKQV